MFKIKFIKNCTEFSLSAPSIGVLVMEVWNIWEKSFKSGEMVFLDLPVDTPESFVVFNITKEGVKIVKGESK